MKYYNYKTKKITEESDNKSLVFLYNNPFGRILLKIATLKFPSNLVRLYMNSSLSKGRINKFIKENNINMDEYIKCDYKSFNDFFMREIDKSNRPLEEGFISPCDSKILVYDINDDLELHIKNSIYTIDELIGEDGSRYKNGKALVFRLCVDDYHHYIFPFDGEIESSKYINGRLHTVQPIAQKKCKVFSENSRVVTTLKTKEYGTVSYIEVGALLIGRIVNESVSKFKKGDEKGHFEFGGSTIILLFEENKIKINKTIENNSSKDIETIIKMGMNLE